MRGSSVPGQIHEMSRLVGRRRTMSPADQFASWCQQHQLRLFQAHRADIECFARDLEARDRARPTITRWG